MPTENQSSGGEPTPSAPEQETLQYFTPPNNHRPPWNPWDLLPTIAVLLVLAFDLLMVYFDQLSNDNGFYIVAILPPVILFGVIIYAVRPRPRRSITIVLGALFAAAVFVVHLAVAVFIICALAGRVRG